MVTEDESLTCDGYLRPPHPAPPVLYLQCPDETRKALCQTCALRWLLSEDEWPSTKSKHEAKESSPTSNEISS